MLLPVPLVFPCFAAIGTQIKSRRTGAFGRTVAALGDGSVGKHDGAGNNLMAHTVARVDKHRISPCLAIVRALAHRKCEILPVSGVGDAVHVEQRPVGKMAERTAGHIAVRDLKEGRSRLPSRCTGVEARTDNLHLAAVLFGGSEPYSKKVAVVAPCDSGLMVVAVERRAVYRRDHKRNRLQEEGLFGSLGPGILLLGNVA